MNASMNGRRSQQLARSRTEAAADCVRFHGSASSQPRRTDVSNAPDTGTASRFGPDFASFDDDPFHRYLGLRLMERRDGYARLRLEVRETTPAGIGGSVNGGVIATLVDMAALPAVFTGMREGGHPAGTADLQVSYLRQAHGAWIEGEAVVEKRGRQLCYVDVDVRNDAGTLCARGRVLYALRAG